MSTPLIVTVWSWSLDVAPARQAQLEEWLAPDERARAARLVTERLRGRWIVARGGLRAILAREANSSPHILSFSYSEHGKPTLSGGMSGRHFNLSHSDDRAILAICGAPIGADVERIGAAHEDVAVNYFSPVEAAAFMATPEAERAEAFYRWWTAKEAFLKALGTGFSRPSDGFTMSCAPGAAPRLTDVSWLEEPLDDWRFAQFRPAPGFMGAVGVRAAGQELQIELREWAD